MHFLKNHYYKIYFSKKRSSNKFITTLDNISKSDITFEMLICYWLMLPSLKACQNYSEGMIEGTTKSHYFLFKEIIKNVHFDIFICKNV